MRLEEILKIFRKFSLRQDSVEEQIAELVKLLCQCTNVFDKQNELLVKHSRDLKDIYQHINADKLPQQLTEQEQEENYPLKLTRLEYSILSNLVKNKMEEFMGSDFPTEKAIERFKKLSYKLSILRGKH